MDASSSAYQIMSYFLVNHDLAKKTNLLTSEDEKELIRDLYSDLLIEFQSCISDLIEDEAAKVALVKNKLTRNLFKSVFMPLVYGKNIVLRLMFLRL